MGHLLRCSNIYKSNHNGLPLQPIRSAGAPLLGTLKSFYGIIAVPKILAQSLEDHSIVI